MLEENLCDLPKSFLKNDCFQGKKPFTPKKINEDSKKMLLKVPYVYEIR